MCQRKEKVRDGMLRNQKPGFRTAIRSWEGTSPQLSRTDLAGTSAQGLYLRHSCEDKLPKIGRKLRVRAELRLGSVRPSLPRAGSDLNAHRASHGNLLKRGLCFGRTLASTSPSLHSPLLISQACEHRKASRSSPNEQGQDAGHARAVSRCSARRGAAC
eukprot:1517789-Pleurochrysis_carterae.AAC.1